MQIKNYFPLVTHPFSKQSSQPIVNTKEAAFNVALLQYSFILLFTYSYWSYIRTSETGIWTWGMTIRMGDITKAAIKNTNALIMFH